MGEVEIRLPFKYLSPSLQVHMTAPEDSIRIHDWVELQDLDPFLGQVCGRRRIVTTLQQWDKLLLELNGNELANKHF